MNPSLQCAHARLCEVLRSYDSMLIAYSGGVDSGLLAYVAHRELGDGARAVLGLSESLGGREREAAIAFLHQHGIPYSTVSTSEMQDERYRRNHADRCYFCKRELFSELAGMARELGARHVAYGANVDDQGDYRPGARAAVEASVVAPLVDAGLDKSTVRALARALGLSLWDKPAAPCLASRIPYFNEVTPEKLRQVEAAEDILKDLGFAICRVRHHGKVARVEVPAEDHARIRSGDLWQRITHDFTTLGFAGVTLEAGGFRSGRLNDALEADGRRG
jgi:uncharacterized protein